MSPWTRYSYAMTNQYAKKGGIKTLTCNTGDFSVLPTSQRIYSQLADMNPFNGAKTAKLPTHCPTKKELKDTCSHVIHVNSRN